MGNIFGNKFDVEKEKLVLERDKLSLERDRTALERDRLAQTEALERDRLAQERELAKEKLAQDKELADRNFALEFRYDNDMFYSAKLASITGLRTPYEQWGLFGSLIFFFLRTVPTINTAIKAHRYLSKKTPDAEKKKLLIELGIVANDIPARTTELRLLKSKGKFAAMLPLAWLMYIVYAKRMQSIVSKRK